MQSLQCSRVVVVRSLTWLLSRFNEVSLTRFVALSKIISRDAAESRGNSTLLSRNSNLNLDSKKNAMGTAKVGTSPFIDGRMNQSISSIDRSIVLISNERIG